MVSNNTTFDMCSGYESYRVVGKRMDLIANYISAPVGFVSCVSFYSLSLIVFLREVKKGESAYIYQTLCCASEIFASTFDLLFVLTRYFWSGMYERSVSWFVSCYACMWYTAHLSVGIAEIFNTLTWMFSICMTFDRVFALYKPFVYRTRNQRKHLTCAIFFSLVVAINIAVFDGLVFYVQEDPTGYKVMADTVFIDSMPGQIFGMTNASTRLILTVALISGNLGTIYLYRREVSKKKAKVFTSADDKKEQRKKEAERTLIFLCVCQATFNTIDIIRLLMSYLIYFIDINLLLCGDVAVYVIYMSRWVVKIGDFAFMLLTNKDVRKMFAALMPWSKVISKISQAGVSMKRSTQRTK